VLTQSAADPSRGGEEEVTPSCQGSSPAS
jgi:hypothetical protein